MSLDRQKRTLLYLLIATGLCCILAFFRDALPELTLITPVIFALALIGSNLKYQRFGAGGLIILISFGLIFLYGTIPFYAVGQLVSDNFFIIQSFGFFGAFAMVVLITKLSLIEIKLGFLPILMIITFPIIASSLLSLIINRQIFILRPGDGIANFPWTILVTQLLMTLIIVTAMKSRGNNVISN
jgi:hypothetical protein